jgi:hypothetical protein
MVEIEQVKEEEELVEEEAEETTTSREKLKIGEWTELMGEELVMKVGYATFRVYV